MTNVMDATNVEYRVALVEPRSRQLLALEFDSSRLLRVSISPRQRWTRQLQLLLERDWGIHGAVVEFLPLHSRDPRCAVVELLTDDFPTHFRVTDLDEFNGTELSDAERDDLQALLDDKVESQVSRFGWLIEALRWVEHTTGSRIRSNHSVAQFNAGRGFALLEMPMQDDRVFWLKASSFPNGHEATLTKVLSLVCPESLPTWVAEQPEWNAWLMMGQSTCVFDVTENRGLCGRLQYAVKSLARLQSQTFHLERTLLEAGAFDQRVCVLRRDADLLFSCVEEAMRHRSASEDIPINSGRLDRLRHIFEVACSCIEGLGIPPAVVHGDMSLGNLSFVGDRCQFLDWSEGYLGFPLVTLHHLLLLNPHVRPHERNRLNEDLKDIYRDALEGISPQALDEGFLWMPFLAAASTLYGRGKWLHTGESRDPRRYAFVRSMARHMDFAARQLSVRSAATV